MGIINIKKILLKFIHLNGDTDLFYPITKAECVEVNDNTTLQSYINKIDTISEGATKTEKSNTNGYLTIDGNEIEVYRLPGDWTGPTSDDASNATVIFDESSSRSNISSGEKLSILFGKISKYFSDLKSLAFMDKIGTNQLDDTLLAEYNKRITTDNVTTSTSITKAGWVADARVINSLKSQIDIIDALISSLKVSVIFENCSGNINSNGFTITIPDSIINSEISHYIGVARIEWSTAGTCSEITFSISKTSTKTYHHTIFSTKKTTGKFDSSYVYHLALTISDNTLVFKMYDNLNASLVTDFSTIASNAEVDLYDVRLSKE